VIDLVEGRPPAADFDDDVFGGGLPDERSRVFVPVVGPGGDRGGEVLDAVEGAAAESFVGEFFEPPFDEVEPGTGGRGEVKVPAATIFVGQPLLDGRGGVRGQVVQDDVDTEAARDGGVDLLEEPQYVGAGVPLAELGEHLPGGDVHRREHLDGAVASVVMGHRPGPARFHRQRRLRAVQRLALGLLVEGENNRPGRRFEVHPNDIDELLLKPGVVGHLERGDLPRLEVVVGPDLGDGVLADAQPRRQRPRRPAGAAVGRPLLMSHPQHFGHRPRRQGRLTTPALGDRPDAAHALLSEPGTPPPHRIRVHPTSPADLVVGDPIGRPQQRPRLHHLPVQQRRRHRHPLQLESLLIGHRQRRSHHDRILPNNHVNLQAHH